MRLSALAGVGLYGSLECTFSAKMVLGQEQFERWLAAFFHSKGFIFELHSCMKVDCKMYVALG